MEINNELVDALLRKAANLCGAEIVSKLSSAIEAGDNKEVLSLIGTVEAASMSVSDMAFDPNSRLFEAIKAQFKSEGEGAGKSESDPPVQAGPGMQG